MTNKSLCKKHGCDFEENYTFKDCIVQICVCCGRRITHPVFNGMHDEVRYAHENRRVFIQLGNIRATSEIRRDEKWAVDFCKGEMVDHEREHLSRRFAHREELISV